MHACSFFQPWLIHVRVVEAQTVLPRGRSDDLDVLTSHLADALVLVEKADEPVILSAGKAETSPVLVELDFAPSEGKSLVANGVHLGHSP